MNKKSIIQAIKELFTNEELAQDVPVGYVDVKTQDGRILRVSDIAVEGSVKEITYEGDNAIEVDVEDGTYVLEDGSSLIVEGGMIKNIVDAEAEVDVETEMKEEAEVKANFMDIKLKDGTEIHIDTMVEGEISKGDKVSIGDAPAPTGEHELEDGRIIVVDEMGMISEIKDAMEEEMEDVISESEKEAIGVVNNLKSLIAEIKDLKTKFESLEKENKEMKESFGKMPSVEGTNTKVDFKFEAKEEKVKSPLHFMIEGNKK